MLYTLCMQVQAILFDLDGTLIDTEPTSAQAIRECFAQWKIQIQPGDEAYTIGRTFENTCQYLFQKYPPPLPREIAQKQIRDQYFLNIQKNLPVVPGSPEAVQALAAHYPLALVSGSTRSQIVWALKKLKILDFFQIILGAEDYPRSKPHPDGYLKAIQALKTIPQNCIVFEDSEPGIASARAANTRVIAITSTNYFQQDLSQADQKIADFLSVTPEWIQKFAHSVSECSEKWTNR